MKDKKQEKPKVRDDASLWKRVEKSTTPLPFEARNFHSELTDWLDTETPEEKVSLPPVFKKAVQREAIRPLPQPKNPDKKVSLQAHPIEKPILKKLAKGKKSIDARIDLHGMTQDRAKQALLDFLQLSMTAEHRVVLVITGKGNAGLGVLRQRVPQWLSLPPFTEFVNGFTESHVSHGGSGALYVRIRRKRR